MPMDRVELFFRIQAQGDAALIGNDDDFHARLVQAGDGGSDAREQNELVGRGNVAAFRHLTIDDPVAIEEDMTD